MSEQRVIEALRICRSLVGHLISESRRSVETIRANLLRNYQSGDTLRGAQNIEYLVTIQLKEMAVEKMLHEIETLETNAHYIAKRDINSETQQALDRLNAAALIDKSGVLKQQLARLPTPKHSHIELSHEIKVLFSGGRPTGDETSEMLPMIANFLQIPLEWLETASGRKAKQAVPEVAPMPVPASMPMQGPAPEMWPGYGAPPAPMSPEMFPPQVAPGYGAPPSNPYANVPGYGAPPPVLPRY